MEPPERWGTTRHRYGGSLQGATHPKGQQGAASALPNPNEKGHGRRNQAEPEHPREQGTSTPRKKKPDDTKST